MAHGPVKLHRLRHLAWVLPALGPIACTPTDASPRPLQATPPSQSLPLTVSPETLSLGTLTPGDSARGTLTLRNRRSEPLTVARVETTCHCVRLTPLPLTIAPGDEATIRVELDPSDEPDYRGALAIDVKGRAAGGQTLFETTVLVEVAAPETEPARPIEIDRPSVDGVRRDRGESP